MNSVELDELRERVSAVRASTVSARSRAVYANSYSRFVSWLIRNKSVTVSPTFLASRDPFPREEKALRKLVKETISGDKNNFPIQFASLEVVEFVSWFLTLEKGGGEPLSYSAMNTHRAGLFNLYREHGASMHKELEVELSNHFKGLKRTLVEQANSGEVPAKTGKDPLASDFYRFLCEAMLKGESKEVVFARASMMLAWNLMCRSPNTFGIHHIHVEWFDDALRIYFAQMKNDQSGERPRDPRYVYANPICPATCPILALGLYRMVYEFESQSNLLFPGGRQYDRFRRELLRLLDHGDAQTELNRRGMKREDPSTRSMRKGGRNLCIFGVHCAPFVNGISSASWLIPWRCSEYLPSLRECGRHARGQNRAHDEFFSNAIAVIFPNASSPLNFALEHAPASVTYHVNFLKQTIPTMHPIFSTPLFQNKDLLFGLSERVECSYAGPGDKARATGVPPHISLLQQMTELLRAARATVEHIDTTGVCVVKDIVHKLEGRAIGAGTATYDGLDAIVMRCLDSAGVAKVVEQLRSNTEASANDGMVDQREWPVHDWGGRFRRMAKDFKLPDCGVYSAWLEWCCGNTSKCTPPLRKLVPADLGTKDVMGLLITWVLGSRECGFFTHMSFTTSSKPTRYVQSVTH